jgi:hypothetical protein
MEIWIHRTLASSIKLWRSKLYNQINVNSSSTCSLKTHVIILTGNKCCAKYVFHRFIWIDMDVIHLLGLFEHWYHAHYLDMNVICLFALFTHKCCMSIHVVYTQKSCTQLSYLNNMNLWNNKFCTNLDWTHEACKFVMDNKNNNHKLFLWKYWWCK